MKIRYIRDSIRGNNENNFCHWTEIQAIDYAGENIALNKVVSCSHTPNEGTLSLVTDGTVEASSYIYFQNTANDMITITIDLVDIYDIDVINIWHGFLKIRTYKNAVLETSIDGVNWTTIFNSETDGRYEESEEGKSHKLEDSNIQPLTVNNTLNDFIDYFDKFFNTNLTPMKNLIKYYYDKLSIEYSDENMINLINRLSILAESYKEKNINYLYNRGVENVAITLSTGNGGQIKNEDHIYLYGVYFNSVLTSGGLTVDYEYNIGDEMKYLYLNIVTTSMGEGGTLRLGDNSLVYIGATGLLKIDLSSYSSFSSFSISATGNLKIYEIYMSNI